AMSKPRGRTQGQQLYPRRGGAPRHRPCLNTRPVPTDTGGTQTEKPETGVQDNAILCLTLMRTPVVKRQTSPESGFFAFFRQLGPGAVILWQRVLTWFLSAGAAIMWLHQTLIE